MTTITELLGHLASDLNTLTTFCVPLRKGWVTIWDGLLHLPLGSETVRINYIRIIIIVETRIWVCDRPVRWSSDLWIAGSSLAADGVVFILGIVLWQTSLSSTSLALEHHV